MRVKMTVKGKSTDDLARDLNSKIKAKQDSETKTWVERTLHDPDLDAFITEFEGNLQIDKTDLDTEWEHHPEQYQKVADSHALHASRLDAAKQYLKIVESEVQAAIRDEIMQGEGKVTEKEIAFRIEQHSEVKDVNADILRLNHSVKRLGALKESFGERRWALRDLVQLYVSAYYSDAGSSVSADKIKTQSADAARAAMNRARHQRES